MRRTYNSKLTHLCFILFAILNNIRAQAQDDIYMVIGSSFSIDNQSSTKLVSNKNIKIGFGKRKNQLRLELLYDKFWQQNESNSYINLDFIGLNGYYDFFNIDNITVYLAGGFGFLTNTVYQDQNILPRILCNKFYTYGIGCHIQFKENLKVAGELKNFVFDNKNSSYLNVALIIDL